MTKKKFIPEPEVGNLLGVIDLDMFIVRVRNAEAELEDWYHNARWKTECVDPDDVTEMTENLERKLQDAKAMLAMWVIAQRKVLMYAPEWWLAIQSGETLDVTIPLTDAAHAKRQEEDAARRIEYLKKEGDYDYWMKFEANLKRGKIGDFGDGA